jgi:hypothetical protein
MHACRQALAAAVVACVALTAPSARAQLHWDVGAQVGAAKRFTTGGDAGAPAPGFGPVGAIQGHVALVPMVRIGAYFAQDVSPVSGAGTRTFWEGGLHAKVTPPLLAAPWRAYAFVGVGYAYTYRTSYHGAPVTTAAGGGATPNVLFAGASGGLLDVPFGLGLGAKAFGLRWPWVLFAELGARAGLAFWGPMYAGGAAPAPGDAGGLATGAAPFLGKDSFALTLSLGLSLEQ